MKEKTTGFSEDKSAFANMPQGVRMTAYPKQTHINTEMDDSIKGIDETIEHGISDVRKHISNQK